MQSRRVLSVFSLVMINVIAVDSLRTLPISAKLGLPLISYYLLAAFTFFVPVALVSAELATAFPEGGGLYLWVREAFGKRAGFMTIWLQWIYNVVWYPTILAFITATLTYLFDAPWTHEKGFLLCMIISLFWIFTLLNCFGMRVSSLVSTLGALFGTLLPIIGISILGGVWLYLGKPIQTTEVTSWLPDFSQIGNLSLFSAVLFGLLGMEMSAVHAEEVKNPQHDYPKALFYSTLVIFSTLVLGSLAIVIVVPNQTLSVVTGLMEAYGLFFNAYHLSWMIPITAICIILGGLSGVAAWIIGPTKGLLVSARDGCLPVALTRVNQFGAPVPILIIQGIIFSILSSIFILSDSLNAAYWMLSDLSAQMALIVYLFMFAAAIRLRYKKPFLIRAYKIPGGKVGMWLVAGIGFLCCFLAILIGFAPPTQIPIEHVGYFEAFLFGGLLIFMVIPWFLTRRIDC